MDTQHKDQLARAYSEGFHAGYKAAQEGLSEADCLPFTPISPAATANTRITSEDVYKAYPRKVGKLAALRAIERAVRLMPETPGISKWEAMLARVQAYAKATANWPLTDRQFIPHPATWFNQGRYDDDQAEWGEEQPSQFSNAH